jgi:hypothetical protein
VLDPDLRHRNGCFDWRTCRRFARRDRRRSENLYVTSRNWTSLGVLVSLRTALLSADPLLRGTARACARSAKRTPRGYRAAEARHRRVRQWPETQKKVSSGAHCTGPVPGDAACLQLTQDGARRSCDGRLGTAEHSQGPRR